MRSPEQQEKDESYEAMVDARLEVMMADFNQVSAIVDDVIGSSDHGDNGCTEIANDICRLISTTNPGTAAELSYDFMIKMKRLVSARIRLDAETEVADECARSFDEKAESQHQQREDMEH